MKTVFDPACPRGHVTRGGHKARIVATDMKGERPMLALVQMEDGSEVAHTYFASGSYSKPIQNTVSAHEFDLLDAEVPKRQIWLVWPVGIQNPNVVDVIYGEPSAEARAKSSESVKVLGPFEIDA